MAAGGDIPRRHRALPALLMPVLRPIHRLRLGYRYKPISRGHGYRFIRRAPVEYPKCMTNDAGGDVSEDNPALGMQAATKAADDDRATSMVIASGLTAKVA